MDGEMHGKSQWIEGKFFLEKKSPQKKGESMVSCRNTFFFLDFEGDFGCMVLDIVLDLGVFLTKRICLGKSH